MDNKSFFKEYITNNNLSNTIFTAFSKLEKNVSSNIKAKINYEIISYEIRNFGNVDHFFCDFKKNITAIVGHPASGKTAKIEALIWILFGENKTNKNISIFNEKTCGSVNIKVGNDVYVITRENNNGVNNCKIHLNSDEKPIVSGQNQCNKYIEELLNIDYNTFISIFYTGDLVNLLHKQQPIETKQVFINMFDNEYWEKISFSARKAMEELEKEFIKNKTIVSSIEEISGTTIESMKQELIDNKETIDNIKLKNNKYVLDELESEYKKTMDKKYSYHDDISINEQQIKKQIANAENIVSFLKEHGKNNVTEFLSLEKELEEKNTKQQTILLNGKHIKNIIDNLKEKKCPIIGVECTTIDKSYIDNKIKEKDKLSKEYESLKNEITSFVDKKNNIVNIFAKYGIHEITDKNISNSISSLEKEISDYNSLLSKKSIADSLIAKLDKELLSINKQVDAEKAKYSTYVEDVALLKSRNETIEQTIKQYNAALKNVSNIKKIEKEISIYKTIYELCQKNNLPKEQALSMTKDIAKKIKAFCKQLLPFDKYEFDENMQLIVDAINFKMYNSASKRIFDIAFRYSVAKTVCSKNIPLFIIEDIGLYQNDSSLKKLVNILNTMKADKIIFTSNRL
jgi:DNA repair exonuclease SbcCD ATPase subunit